MTSLVRHQRDRDAIRCIRTDKVEVDSLERLTVLELAFLRRLPGLLRNGHALQDGWAGEGEDRIVRDDGWTRREDGMLREGGGGVVRHALSGRERVVGEYVSTEPSECW